MRKVIAVGLILTLSFVPAAVIRGQETSQKNVLTIGKVTRKVSKWQKRFEPIAAYLASRLGNMGIER